MSAQAELATPLKGSPAARAARGDADADTRRLAVGLADSDTVGLTDATAAALEAALEAAAVGETATEAGFTSPAGPRAWAGRI
jgi:hypothetical protein